MITIRHLTGQVRSVIVQRTICPLHILYMFILSDLHPLLIRQSLLVGHSLSVTCPLHMRYSCVLCAPYTFREDPHRHRDDFHHRVTTRLIFFCIFFCSFGVRIPYPFICGSTISHVLSYCFIVFKYVVLILRREKYILGRIGLIFGEMLD